jgi:hypothetical protein
LYGGSGPDDICGGPGDDNLWGEDDDDTLSGDLDSDHNDGGGGFDTCENENPTSCASWIVSCQW